MANNDLKNANKNKNDEFYTSLDDIEKEMKYYKEYFRNKTIFCNCDDPYESNFFKYFAMNFNALGLKKLISTCYAGSAIITEQLSLFDVKGIVVNKSTEKTPYKIEITKVPDSNGDGAIDLSDVKYLIKNKKNVLTILKGDGDFRSDECIKLLKDADIVVTNPPFSLFREYVAQLIEYNKKFLIIGNVNSITYKDFFALLKGNNIWMGVPITFMDKYNPEQFKIVALGIVGSCQFKSERKMEILDKDGKGTGKYTINAKGTLYRKFNPDVDKKPTFRDVETNELYSSIYARILIEKIGSEE